MNQKKLLGAVLLVIGAMGLYFGFNAADAPAEQLTEAFTGRYSDQTMIYLVGGAASAIAGLVLLIRK